MLSTSALIKKTGISQRQIDRWCKLGIISPVGRANPGQGRHREWDPNIVEKVKLLVRVSKAHNHQIPVTILKKIYKNYERGSIDLGKGLILTWG